MPTCINLALITTILPLNLKCKTQKLIFRFNSKIKKGPLNCVLDWQLKYIPVCQGHGPFPKGGRGPIFVI